MTNNCENAVETFDIRTYDMLEGRYCPDLVDYMINSSLIEYFYGGKYVQVPNFNFVFKNAKSLELFKDQYRTVWLRCVWFLAGQIFNGSTLNFLLSYLPNIAIDRVQYPLVESTKKNYKKNCCKKFFIVYIEQFWYFFKTSEPWKEHRTLSGNYLSFGLRETIIGKIIPDVQNHVKVPNFGSLF